MISYRTEPFAKFFADAKEDMIPRHWAEAGTFPDVRKLQIDEQKFLQADALGILIVITARDDGELIGYAMGHVIAAHHVANSKTGEQAYYYVNPAYRGAGVFRDLCREFEAASRAKNATTCNARQKIGPDGRLSVPDAFFEKMGYEKTEVVWKKRL